MKKEKLLKKIGVAALSFSVFFTFSVSAFAASDPGKIIKTDWVNFRGNRENNAVIDAKTPVKPEDAMLYWSVKNGTGWSAAPGSPILVDGYLYFNAGKELVKLDAVSGEVVKKGPMVGVSSFSICPPTYADGKIFVGLANGVVQAFDADTLDSLWVYHDELRGQPNTTIAYKNGRVYTGFWNSETRDANFACLSVKDNNPKEKTEEKKAQWTYTVKGGFYWAGAYVSDDFVAVGTDDGDGGCESETSKLLVFNPKTGKLLDQKTGFKGDIRSNISYDKVTDRYYFTSKGGGFYSVKISDKGKISGLKSMELGGMSTSTPAINNGRAYIGVSGTKGHFAKDSGHSITVIDLKNWKIAYKALTIGYPQTSGLVSTGEKDGYNYVYFFENYTPGTLRMIKDKPGQTKPERMTPVTEEESENHADALFVPQGAQAQYAICSPIADEYGTIYFKNDSCNVMALGSKVTGLEVTKAPSQKTYDIGDKARLNGIRVYAKLANGMKRDVSDYVTASADPVKSGQKDITVMYPYQMYNNEGPADPVFASVPIKVNSKAVSEANNKKKAQIKTKKVAGLSVKRGSKSATVQWKKTSGASGYQVSRAYGKNGKFKSVKFTSNTSFKNTKLKSGKTYRYKVRPYKTINGVKYYGKWSPVKTVKVK